MQIKQIITLLVSPFLIGTSNASTASAAAAAAVKSTGIDYRFFVAGGVCAATSHGITTPIDVVKTKMQANPEVYNKGIVDATKSILKSDGPSALLGGLGPTVVGYGIEGAMKFGVYEIMKPVMLSLLKDNTAVAFMAAAVIAGAVASIILCPMESMRIRMVTDPSYQGLNFFTGFPKLMKEEGLFSTFAGIWAMLSKQVPYTMAKQVSFDIVASFIYALVAEKASHVKKEDIKFIVSVSAAFVASIVACLSSQPGDMILTETYKGASSGDNVFGVIKKIHNRGGLGAFFTGTQARILHVSTIITSQLVIYDIVKQLLGLPATGSH